MPRQTRYMVSVSVRGCNIEPTEETAYFRPDHCPHDSGPSLEVDRIGPELDEGPPRG